MVAVFNKRFILGNVRFFVLWLAVLVLALLSMNTNINNKTISSQENSLFDFI
jgi:hypothetical protein